MTERLDVHAPHDGVRVIAITGEITSESENLLMDAYERASADGVTAIILDLSALGYMNSGGIGLLVMLLVRAQRQGQRVLGYGLSEHYRHIFELTRLDEAIAIHHDKQTALAAALP
jgi:anti-sigma B factor antagonist